MESGKFVLRLPPEMHQALKNAAKKTHVSLNEFIKRQLSHTDGGRNHFADPIISQWQGEPIQNRSLALDYIKRCGSRVKALDALFDDKSWADVVGESQEVVELALKALLRFSNIEFPRVHDVSSIIENEKSHLPKSVVTHLPRMIKISKSLRRDRELAFYGSEDLTPSEFYKKSDAEEARDNARWVVGILNRIIV
jgi:HEPN domain-containing protein